MHAVRSICFRMHLHIHACLLFAGDEAQRLRVDVATLSQRLLEMHATVAAMQTQLVQFTTTRPPSSVAYQMPAQSSSDWDALTPAAVAVAVAVAGDTATQPIMNSDAMRSDRR